MMLYGLCTGRMVYISHPALDLVYIGLKRYKDTLEDPMQWKREKFIQVRMELVYETILLEKSIRPKKIPKSVYYVDCLHKAECIASKSVEEIAGENWLHA